VIDGTPKEIIIKMMSPHFGSIRMNVKIIISYGDYYNVVREYT
jgi:hypothetical protein